MQQPRRKTWHVEHLDIVDEPMILSLLKYRQYADRQPSEEDANVVSSHIVGSRKHAPILDLDFPHRYVPSSTPGHHGHLYLDVPTSRWRMYALLIGLYLAQQIEFGFLVWSIRRGGTFVRREGVEKTPDEAAVKYTYGMFFKLRKRNE